ncbi:MAG: tRNA (N6-isopentenyl adenosine(37)-C2)-methylthiotransferase MiaB [Alphaproteobacteria bacterium]|nr:tRNA (N6-isopentenyl adenosine(37)-C2)-methylthiotransferase MiaB [Alphaproteobacteria bacterium]OJV13572.1 MAG: tRNA (N6-isopentenyl adenosine(37)-C2)-methylthiotransferase MiaB [Alphaproteobacteria bacterium 33-17]
MKNLHIITYGCQMNVYDSVKMAELLAPYGYTQTENMEDSDLIILNTCNIREKAAEKVYSELGRIKKIKDKHESAGRKMFIAVAGCVSQAEGDEIFKRAPQVDIVVGPQSYTTLPDLLSKVSRDEIKHAINLDFVSEDKFDSLPEETNSQGVSAFLSIQEGCDKFCTFCVVPYTRGAEFSRPISDVYREAVKLAELGAKEITLLGQNVTAYHGASPEGEKTIADLIRIIAKIDGIERIRYMTSHPRDMTDEIIDLHGSEPKLMPFLHLPIQSGSNNVLRAMNRKHTAEDYLRIIEKFRKARPDMAFSSDFIVGFPGETDQDFEDTMELVRKVGFSQCYSFKYSIRPGTPAANKEEQVPEDVKTERLARLQALLASQQTEFNQSTIGKTVAVLFDKKGKYEGQVIGRSPYMQSVHLAGHPELLGKIANVKLVSMFTYSIAAELEEELA